MTAYAGPMWRLSSTNDSRRYVDWRGGKWTADPETRETLEAAFTLGASVTVAPLAGSYQPTGPDDPVGVYLLARASLPTPHTVTGTPPTLPAPEAATPEGAVN